MVKSSNVTIREWGNIEKPMTKKQKLLLYPLLALSVLTACISLVMILELEADRSGWIEIKDGYACLDEDGKRRIGWYTADDITWYFSPEGVMQTGLCAIDGNTYFLGDDGAMRTGWQVIDGSQYRFGNDGKMLTGWKTVGDRLYYFGTDGKTASGWVQEDGVSRYLLADGSAATGTMLIDNCVYFFTPDGIAHTGWLETEGGKAYYNENGVRQSGWQCIDGKYYLLNELGQAETGWHQQGEYRFYLTEDGSAAAGPTEIDGRTYYFTPRGIEVMLVNAAHAIPADYKPQLEILVEWYQICAQAKPHLAQMIADCQAAGNEITINSTYRTHEQQKEILALRTEEYMGRGMNGANAYAKARETVALPGTSEHEMGLAADLIGAAANQWLAQHCWEYGFIVRYPDGKSAVTGINYEPWHYRYVGTMVSLDMQTTGLCLEEYLGAA